MRGLPLDDIKKDKKKYLGGAAGAIALLVVLFHLHVFSYLKILVVPIDDKHICPMWDIQRPKSYASGDDTVSKILFDDQYRVRSLDRLSGMVQVDTQVYDNPPQVDEDPEYWAKFKKLHKFLETTYPAIHETLEVVKVNTYGLVYIWKGSDKSLKPIVLTGHQDTVPIQAETLKDWTYPPLDGFYDKEYLYGRGSSDCKNVVSGILESIDLLLERNFKPKRTVIVALGMDEEVSGWNGAQKISEYLEARYGKDSMYALIDEGMGLTKENSTGRIVALPGTREKGYVDIVAQLYTPGGHSSVPPDHTSIGIMGELSTVIESDPYSPLLTKENPTLDFMQCLAKNAKDSMGLMRRKAILRAGYDKFCNSLVLKALTKTTFTKYLVQTAQSMNIVTGGEKSNALPESVKLVTNHRISLEATVQEILDRYAVRVLQVARKHGLGVVSYGKTLIEDTGKGHFVISVQGHSLEAAPAAPTDDDAWKSLVGVTRHLYEDLVFPEMKKPVIVSPSIMTANTDTRHYWNLTRSIFRYTPFYSLDVMGETHIHSVDERVSVDNHMRTVAFFYEYLQVIDEK